ncbi:MAG TPA: hypothetical protein VNA22_05640 [Pyrinomonadaceae bacterium]|nr:hypothetical protein [Pyrinomonadaceae bacterium]
MKLRIKGNSIRLRLLKSEVDRFAAEGRVTEQTSFGANSLKYTLAVSPDAERVYAEFDDGEICVYVPESQAHAWAIGDEVGFEAEQLIGDGLILSLLVEKDFVCVGRPDDPDRHDAFTAPV